MGMEQYMGYRAVTKVKENEEGRQLPLFNICGTDFIVDVARREFRQADNPKNRIIMLDVKEDYGFSFFYYDMRTRNIYIGQTANLPPHAALIIVPPLKDLDPIGHARVQGLPDDFYQSRKTRNVETLPQLQCNKSKTEKTDRNRRIKMN